MYRKRIEMSETEGTPAAPSQTIVDRVTQLPVVTSAYDVATQYYNLAKESNSFVKATLDTAEKSLKYAADTAKPVVDKLGAPIAVVDGLACKGFDKLEETFPAIKKTPEEIAKETKGMIQPVVDRYENAKQYGMDTVTSVKDYGVQKASDLMETQYGQAVTSVKNYGVQKASDLMETQYGQAVAATVTNTIDKTIDKADQYMDYYLPAKEGEDETATKLNAEDGLVDKLSKVSTKVRRRVSTITLAEVENVQKRTRDTLAHLHVVLDLVQTAKTNLNTQALQERLAVLQTKAKAMWEDLNKEQPADTETPKTLEQQSLALARYLTQSLVTFYNKSSQSLSTLPVSLQPTVSQMQQYGTELFGQVTKITKLEDVTAVVMTQVQEKSKAIQDTVTSLRDSAMKLQPLEWVGNGSPQEESPKQETQEHS